MVVPPAVVMPRLPTFIESLLRLEGSLPPAASAREGARYVVRPDFLEPSHQREVTLINRLTVVHWIMLYCDRQMLRHNTFAAAVALLDLYLTANPHVKRKVLQSVGGVALLVASKHHEYTGLDIPGIVDAVHALPGSESGAASEASLVSRFFALEVKLCNNLGWMTAPPTVVDWLDVMCLQVGMLADAAAAHLGCIHEGGGGRGTRGRHTREGEGGGGGAGAGAATPRPKFTLQVDAEAYIALLCCTADMRDGSEPDDELVGTPAIVRHPPCISGVTSWPVMLEADMPAFFNSQLPSGAVVPVSPRAPSKLLSDVLNVAAVMAMHAGHARWPPSVLACAAMAAVVAEYDSAAREARITAGERETAHAGAGVASDADVLARFANLRPVVWALIRAWLPGQPVAESRAGATRFLLPAAADLLSPSASRKRKLEDVPDSAASAATASSSEGRAGGDESVLPWSTPWSALPSALSWVSALASDLPLPGPHGDALSFVTDPDFVSLTVPREAGTLKYVTTFSEAYRSHVLDKAGGAPPSPARTRAAFPEAFEERQGQGRERSAPLLRPVPTWSGAGAGLQRMGEE